MTDSTTNFTQRQASKHKRCPGCHGWGKPRMAGIFLHAATGKRISYSLCRYCSRKVVVGGNRAERILHNVEVHLSDQTEVEAAS